MRYLVSLAVAAALLTATASAEATTGFKRLFVTSCRSGQIYAFNNHTGVDWRTPEPCTETLWDSQNQRYYTLDRPWTDFKAGDMAANHFYPGCYNQRDTVNGPYDGEYDQVYAFIC